jgi:hypothetical protein
VDDLSIGLSHPSFQPFLDALQKGPIIHPYPQHVHQPGMVQMVEEALDIDFYHIPILSVLQGAGEVADRLQRPASGAIAVPALQQVLCIARR